MTTKERHDEIASLLATAYVRQKQREINENGEVSVDFGTDRSVYANTKKIRRKK
jgi:hypothetical protein